MMTGAARLAAKSALRTGAGLVTLAAPEAAFAVYSAALTGVIVHPIAGLDDFQTLLADKRRNAVLIGPGAGVGAETRDKTLAILEAEKRAVLDADALTSFADDPGTLFSAICSPCVMTPHEGEFARLFDPTGSKPERARRAAKESGAVIVLKGADTVIASPDGRGRDQRERTARAGDRRQRRCARRDRARASGARHGAVRGRRRGSLDAWRRRSPGRPRPRLGGSCRGIAAGAPGPGTRPNSALAAPCYFPAIP